MPLFLLVKRPFFSWLVFISSSRYPIICSIFVM
jgi:hypothetical protein